MSSESKISPVQQPSLTPLRIAAVLGGVAAVLLVVAGFSASPLLGVIAIILAPVLPLAFVMVTDRLRGA